MGKRTVEQLTQTARNLTFEGKKVIRDADDKVTKGAALKISRLPPDQQEEAAVQPTTSPSPPKKQNTMDGEALLSEFKSVCCRYVSGTESFHRQADIFAGMTISQFDELSDRAYAVMNAIRDFFQKVNEIRN